MSNPNLRPGTQWWNDERLRLNELFGFIRVDPRLTVFATDEAGRFVTEVSGGLRIVELALGGGETLRERLARMQRDAAGIRNCTSFGTPIPGMQLLGVPIPVRGEPTAYLWAGVYIEETAWPMVRASLRERETFAESLDIVPILNERERAMAATRLDGLAAAIAGCAEALRGLERRDRAFERLRGLSVRRMSDEGIPALLDGVMEAADVGFCGYAEAVGGERYRIRHTVGCDGLDGAEFEIGEGFLGQACMLRSPREWAGIETDPRSVFFRSRGVEPLYLLGVPAIGHEEVRGLIFAGGANQAAPPEQAMACLEIAAHFAGAHEDVSAHRRSLRRQQAFLSVLTEISKVLGMTNELKRVFMIMIDLGLQIVEGAGFSFLLYRPPGSAKAQLVCRGLPPEAAERYGREITGRYFKPSADSGMDDGRPRAVRSETLGCDVIECPIAAGGGTAGMLGIQLPSRAETDTVAAVLTVFMNFSCMAIERIAREQAGGELQRAGALLADALAVLDPARHAISERAAAMAQDFASSAGLPAEEIRRIALACRLVPYPVSWLSERLRDDGLLAVLAEFGRIREQANRAEGTAYDRSEAGASADAEAWPPAALMLAVFAYVEHGEAIDAVHELPISPALRMQFASYILRQHTVDLELSLDDGESAPGAGKLDFGKLRQSLGISPREEEVLQLVVQGLNNKEIADVLFISEHTVKNHVTKLFQKLQVPDRAHAIAKVFNAAYPQT